MGIDQGDNLGYSGRRGRFLEHDNPEVSIILPS